MNENLIRVRRGLVLGGFILLAVYNGAAHQGGHFGGYQVGCGGTGCHAQSGQTTLALNGPTSVNPGATANYSFAIAHPTNDYGGMNVSIRNAQGAAGTLAAGNGMQVAGGEIAHTQPKQEAAGQVTFDFQWTAPNQHGTFTFYGAGNAVNNNGGSDGDAYNTMTATITVPGATLTSPSPATSFCVGSQMTINWTQTAIANVRIEMSSNSFATIVVISNSTPGANGTYSYTIPTNTPAATTYELRLVNVADNSELTRVSSFTISGAPIIVMQPTSQAVCENATVTLQTGASGSGVTYAWRKNGTVIPGATGPTYTIAGMSLDDEGSYDCQVGGCGLVTTTQAAVLTMTPVPKITTQPVSKKVCEGESITLSVVATGAGLNYTWIRNGQPVPGGTTATLTINNISGDNEGVYRCRVSGTCQPQAISDSAVITVVDPPIITTQPTGKTLSSGDTLKLSVVSLGDSLRYQWQKNGVDIFGAFFKNYTKEGVARADSGTYRCIIYNSCDSVISSSVVVKVNPSAGPGVLALSIEAVDIGEVFACELFDTTIVGLLVNEGGSPLVIESYDVLAVDAVTLVGLTTPFEIGAGEAVDVHLRINPKVMDFGATVTFNTPGDKKTLSISRIAVSPVVFTEDTLRYTGPVGESICNISMPMPCDEVRIYELSFYPESAAFEIVNMPSLPLSLSRGNTFEICIRATDNQTSSAIFVVRTTDGDRNVQLIRTPVVSVEEDEQQIAGLTIAPNPADDYVLITAEGKSLSVRVLDISGRTVTTLSGENVIRWDLQTNHGSQAAPGLYILVVEDGSHRQVTKILLR